MHKQDGQEFKKLLESTMSGHAGEKVMLPPDVLAWWWEALKPYSFQNVSAAMTVHARRSRFKPTPADLIEIINQQDGRPSADEAWPIALQASDEMATAVWTEEIERAWRHCYPVFESGDEIGARMAFRQHYQKLIEHARMIGKPVSWTVSLGHDPAQRVTALEAAEQKGLLSHDRVAGLLPSPEPTGDGQYIAGLVGYEGTIEKPATDSVKAGLKKLRDALAAASPEPRVNLTEKQKQEEQQRREELAEQERLLTAARENYREAV